MLKRYVGDVSGRVAGFGGNPATILPSPTGLPCADGIPHPEPCLHDLEEFTGKICEVIYGCFGEFEGFVLDTCKTTRAFASRDRSIGELALRVCRDRLTVSVLTELGGGASHCQDTGEGVLASAVKPGHETLPRLSPTRHPIPANWVLPARLERPPGW